MRQKTGTSMRQKSIAAEIYQAQPYYTRFNQKYNMTRQWLWNPPDVELKREQGVNLEKLVAAEKSGYATQDLAFYLGSLGNLNNTGFDINWSDRSGNSWKPLASGRPSGSFIQTGSSKRWDGSPEEASKIIARMARFYGSDLVGFCELDRRWVYSHYFDEETKRDYPIKFSDEAGYEKYDSPGTLDDGVQVIPKEMKYVAVLIFEMDFAGMATAPTITQMATTATAYSKIAYSTVMLAEFIRALGYKAIPSANCTALSVPLAIDAGLGQLARNAKLITPQFGPRCRIAKVITDLPLKPGKPVDMGVTEFCNVCKKCAKNCPAQAIPYGDRSLEPVNECNHHGVLQWQLDHKKCFQYWAKVGTNCGICIRVCPFNKGQGRIHNVSRWFVRHMRGLDPIFVWLDDVLKYGKPIQPEEFWQR
jgi:epoxyqueuosine reductase